MKQQNTSRWCLLVIGWLFASSNAYAQLPADSTAYQKLWRALDSDKAMLYCRDACCAGVNDHLLLRATKVTYKADAYALAKAFLASRYRLYSDTLSVHYVPEELVWSFYHHLVAIRLERGLAFRELHELAIHYNSDTIPKGRVYTQMDLYFEDASEKFCLLYEFRFRESESALWTTKCWLVEFTYCESIETGVVLTVLEEATIPAAVLAARRRAAAAELYPSKRSK